MKVDTEIPVFVISLPISERRQQITQALNTYGYTFSFIEAVDGSLLPKEFVESVNQSDWVKQRYHRQLGAGEMGCALSHLKIYEKMQTEAIDWAIILEDDAIVTSNLQSELSIHQVHLNTAVLYQLGGQKGYPQSKQIIYSLFNRQSVGNIRFRRPIKSDQFIFRTSSYLMSREVAKNLLDFTQQRFCLADDWSVFRQYGLINAIYLADVIGHPEETAEQSTLFSERQESHRLAQESRLKSDTFKGRLKRRLIQLGVGKVKYGMIYFFRQFLRFYWK